MIRPLRAAVHVTRGACFVAATVAVYAGLAVLVILAVTTRKNP